MYKLTTLLILTAVIAGCTTPNVKVDTATTADKSAMPTVDSTLAAPTADTTAPTVTDTTVTTPTTTADPAPTTAPTATVDSTTVTADKPATAPTAIDSPEKILGLAKCLTEKGATFYGTERCSHCQNQKKMFGDAMSAVNFIDCDKSKEKCSNIQGYPTWVFADGSNAVGTQSLENLAQKAGCNM